jgi:hypothetical protein
LGLLLMLALGTMYTVAQTPRSEDDPRNLAPTVNGGTGLFTVYDAQTLRRGEFNFGFFANFFHRDPGDARFQVYPANFQVGFNDYFEFFVNFEAQKLIRSGQPSLLSGYYLPDVRTKTLAPGRVTIRPGTNVVGVTVGDPCGNGGFAGPCAPFGPFTAQPTGNDTRFIQAWGHRSVAFCPPFRQAKFPITFRARHSLRVSPARALATLPSERKFV